MGTGGVHAIYLSKGPKRGGGASLTLAAPPGLRAGMRVGTHPISGPSGRVDGQVLAVTSPPPALSPQGAGDGVLFIYFPAAPGGNWGADRCGAERMGVNLAAGREHGVLGPHCAHREGHARTHTQCLGLFMPATSGARILQHSGVGGPAARPRPGSGHHLRRGAPRYPYTRGQCPPRGRALRAKTAVI